MYLKNLEGCTFRNANPLRKAWLFHEHTQKVANCDFTKYSYTPSNPERPQR